MHVQLLEYPDYIGASICVHLASQQCNNGMVLGNISILGSSGPKIVVPGLNKTRCFPLTDSWSSMPLTATIDGAPYLLPLSPQRRGALPPPTEPATMGRPMSPNNGAPYLLPRAPNVRAPYLLPLSPQRQGAQ